MLRLLRRTVLPLSLVALVACSDASSPEATCDGSGPPCTPQGDGGSGGSVGTGAGMEGGGGTTSAPFEATESYEANIDEGWIAAGQPTEERLTEVVLLGARVISLRTASEDPFDEPGLIAELGGTFIRYPTTASDYESVAFREAMYDLYDAELAKGGYVYLHCASSNRVGASWALYNAERRGVPAEEAVQMGIDAGLSSLEDMVRAILGI